MIPSTDEWQVELTEKIHLLAQALQQRMSTVTTVESCTAGGVAYALTSEPGSSNWFHQGFVTYNNNSKRQLVGVDESLLTEFGAVSDSVAKAMAEGAIIRTQSDFAIAVTGIAGPTGGSEKKPVGTVFFAWSDKIGCTLVERHLFTGNREQIRQQAIFTAIDGMHKFIDSEATA